MKITHSSKTEAVLNEIGARLTQQRIQAKLTQAALAEKASVSKRTVERIEAGNSIQLSTMIQVLRVFKLLEAFGLALTGEVNQEFSSKKTAQIQEKKVLQDHDTKAVKAKSKSRSWGY
ncbi:MAG: helix-turn-helix domain-containing protein [Candidatus Marinimicrobia bacterium]|nr:helix-turn-helix domain-containing protein [Candidatus Neomarinimicrobiota bacterium]